MHYVLIISLFLGENTDGNLGIQNRASLEGRVKKLEIIASGGVLTKKPGQGKKIEKYVSNNNTGVYNKGNDVELTTTSTGKK